MKLSITEEMPKIKLSFIGASPKLEKNTRIRLYNYQNQWNEECLASQIFYILGEKDA